MIDIDFAKIELSLRNINGKTSVFDPVRKRWMILTPEEHVRQYILQYMLQVLCYPIALISVEKGILVGKMNKRFDIVVYNQDHKPWMLVECKAPAVVVNEQTLHQLLNYQQTIQCRYWLLTNGHQTFCADGMDNKVNWLSALPAYNV